MKGFFKSKLFLSLATMVMVLLLTGTISLTSRALAASPNVGTYTAADNGQGAWGGGPLNADGTLGGGASYSLGNGSQVGKLVPTTWNFVNGGQPSISALTCSRSRVLLFSHHRPPAL